MIIIEELLVDQMEEDINNGDTESLDELLTKLWEMSPENRRVMRAYLSDERFKRAAKELNDKQLEQFKAP